MKEAIKPYQRWRHPPGCPDSDWCAGNGVCYWDCQAGPGGDDDEPRGEIEARAEGGPG